MTKLEEFVNYAKTLSPEDLRVLEWRLESLMDSQGTEGWLTAEQEAKALKLATDPDLEFAPQGRVETIFAKYK